MHNTLTEHARCLYGDEYRPAPERGPDHDGRHSAEDLTSADADAILEISGSSPRWLSSAIQPVVPIT